MNYPSFFNKVPKIKVYDPLAHFLGAMDDGIIEYSYLDVVKVAGHSCATVAGAYLSTLKALAALYPDDEIPVRGNIYVEMANAEDEGVTGVIGNVISIITGAKAKDGFKGIGGNFYRNNLLNFEAMGLKGNIKFTRLDTKKSVEIIYSPAVGAAPETMETIGAILQNQASPALVQDFKDKWQLRVEKILLDYFDDKNQIQIL